MNNKQIVNYLSKLISFRCILSFRSRYRCHEGSAHFKGIRRSRNYAYISNSSPFRYSYSFFSFSRPRNNSCVLYVMMIADICTRVRRYTSLIWAFSNCCCNLQRRGPTKDFTASTWVYSQKNWNVNQIYAHISTSGEFSGYSESRTIESEPKFSRLVYPDYAIKFSQKSDPSETERRLKKGSYSKASRRSRWIENRPN